MSLSYEFASLGLQVLRGRLLRMMYSARTGVVKLTNKDSGEGQMRGPSNSGSSHSISSLLKGRNGEEELRINAFL